MEEVGGLGCEGCVYVIIFDGGLERRMGYLWSCCKGWYGESCVGLGVVVERRGDWWPDEMEGWCEER